MRRPLTPTAISSCARTPWGTCTGTSTPTAPCLCSSPPQARADQLIYHLRAYPPTTSQPTWRWADVDTDVTSADAQSAVGQTNARKTTANTTTGTTATGSTATAMTGLTLQALTDAAAPTSPTAPETMTPAATSGNPADYCIGTSYYWTRYDRNIITTWDRLQRIFTLGRTHWVYDWSTTNTTSVDAAGSYKNGALFTAGYTSVQNDSAGVTFKAPNNSNYDAAAQFDSRPYYLYCRDNAYGGKTWYSGYYEWRPYKFTTGNRNLSPKYAIFSCNTKWKTSIDNSAWVARSTEHTYQAGASLGVIEVRVKQQNNEYHKLTFLPDSGVRAWICGSNYFPNGARQVREVHP